MNDEEQLHANQLLATFMSASAPMEAYLQQGGALTPLQLQSLTLTIEGLQSFLNRWVEKYA